MSNFQWFLNLIAVGDVDCVCACYETEYLIMKDENGRTALHQACRVGLIELVILLCDPCNIEAADDCLHRPIHVACQYGHLGVVTYLRQEGCCIEARDNFGNQPLHVACEHGRLDIVKYLCSQQGYLAVDVSNMEWWRPIHFACRGGHLEVVKYLCEQACNREAFTDQSERPLHLACRLGHLGIVKLLCGLDCEIEVSTMNNDRPIHLACFHGHVEIVKYLCSRNCNIEALAMFDCRPIHLAVLQGHIHIVRYLCQQQCKLDVQTKQGKSVLDLGFQNQREVIVNFLIDEDLRRKMIKKVQVMRAECDVLCDHSFCFQSVLAIKFRPDHLVGQGFFGSVYKMKEPQLNYMLCIKSIAFNPDNKNLKTKHIELNINRYIHTISNERIVQYFGTVNTDSDMFIFMEYIEGFSLDKRIRASKSLPHNKVIKYSQEILEGLQFLCQQKIIHRDIKPQNIMLNEQDHVKLCDFGLSCYMESIGHVVPVNSAVPHSEKMTFCGTPNYMAPECVLGLKYSYPVDIWALGASVIEMLTGFPPFSGMENVAVIFKIGTTKTIPFEPAFPISDNMKLFIEHMICPDPASRATPEMLLEYISCFLNPQLTG